MKKVTIHQAYFIPWLGYFSKLAFSDVFVVLDNVLFRERHYFNRTRIVNMHGQIHWLSLPVGQNFKKNCNEVVCSSPNSNYLDNIIVTLEQSYTKASYYKREWPELKAILNDALFSFTNLVDINLSIIKGIIKYLNIKSPKIILSSEILNTHDETLDATSRIIAICKELECDILNIGGGKSESVHDIKLIIEHGINVFGQNYLSIHPIYNQSRRKRVGFQKGLSIVDSILNVGKERTISFLTDNNYSPIQLDFSYNKSQL